MTSTIKYSLLILTILHLVGLVLFGVYSDAPNFSWITISITGILILIAEPNIKKALFSFFIIFLGGYLIELIGIQTGNLFGNYRYTDVMGPKLFGTPVLIGITWYAMVKSSISISRYLTSNRWILILVTALACTLMDFLIEAVAMKYEFWIWEDYRVPLFNYVCWFIFSALFAFSDTFYSSSENRVASVTWVIWILFFSILILL